jgi:hypothetical protein
MFHIYISSSWKNKDKVRHLAELLRKNFEEVSVYDFTDPRCRRCPEVPPETLGSKFDSTKETYKNYLANTPDFLRLAVMENRAAIAKSDLIILLLPCGLDAHADWAFGVGMDKRSIIHGELQDGERVGVHLWAHAASSSEEELLDLVYREIY